MYFFGLFVNANPIERAVIPLPDRPECLPTVDVMVPSYNESAELLELTLTAARTRLQAAVEDQALEMGRHLLEQLAPLDADLS